MGNISKGFAVFIILIIAMSSLSLLMFKPANAQSTTKPTVPEFILRIADHSYDVPPMTTSSIDPYTGKTTTQTQPGYHVINKTIEVTIKNQPFTSYTDANGNKINLYYNISVRPHYSGNWTYYPISNGETYTASTTEYSTRNFIFGAYANGGYAHDGYADKVSPQIGYVAPGGEVDFRVQAQIGYYNFDVIPFGSSAVEGFVGENSGWSNSATIKIPEDIISQLPTASPIVPELPLRVIVPLLLTVFSLALVLRHQKTSR